MPLKVPAPGTVTAAPVTPSLEVQPAREAISKRVSCASPGAAASQAASSGKALRVTDAGLPWSRGFHPRLPTKAGS